MPTARKQATGNLKMIRQPHIFCRSAHALVRACIGVISTRVSDAELFAANQEKDCQEQSDDGHHGVDEESVADPHTVNEWGDGENHDCCAGVTRESHSDDSIAYDLHFLSNVYASGSDGRGLWRQWMRERTSSKESVR